MRSNRLKLHRAVGMMLLVVTSAASCSSGSGRHVTPSTIPLPTTTLRLDVAAKAFETRGPFPVGVTTLKLPKGNLVEVWYPTVPSLSGAETYDVRDYVPPAIKALLTSDIPATFTYYALRNADAAPNKYPVVLFSHGFAGIRMQSSNLTSHLASWGMIVAAPEHPSRDLYHALSFQLGNAHDAVDDLRATLARLRAEDASTSSKLHGRMDFSRIAAVGHSAGGATVLQAAREIPEIDGYISLASGDLRGASTTSTTGGATTSTTRAPLPAKPSLFVAGKDDGVVSVDQVTRPAFDAAPAPTRLWVIDKAGHNAFDDFCILGDGKGIIGIAEASGLGPTLAKPPFDQFKKLGEDGCKPPAAPVEQVWPIIDHVVTSWLRNLFGDDKEPVGLGNDVADQYTVSVRIEERLG